MPYCPVVIFPPGADHALLSGSSFSHQALTMPYYPVVIFPPGADHA
jgi:hypothetical protein